MYKIVIAGLAANLAALAGSIGGSVHDASGAAVPQARVVLWNPVGGGEQAAPTGASGAFSFPNLAAGQFILRVEKPGFASAFREFTIQVDSQVERTVVMGPGTVMSPQVGASNAPTRLRIAGGVQAAQRIYLVQPMYPAGAKAAGIQGLVQIAAIIQKNGTVSELTITESPSDDLAAASLDAVRQWRYKPTMLNGESVEIDTTISLTFSLAR